MRCFLVLLITVFIFLSNCTKKDSGTVPKNDQKIVLINKSAEGDTITLDDAPRHVRYKRKWWFF